MEATGTIYNIGEVRRISDKFSVQDFVIQTEEKYPQTVVFSLTNDKMSLLNGYEIGDRIKVAFNLTGREYNGKFYNTLSCWKIQPMKEKVQQDDEVPF